MNKKQNSEELLVSIRDLSAEEAEHAAGGAPSLPVTRPDIVRPLPPIVRPDRVASTVMCCW